MGQGDMMQARWGSHGDYEVISLSPSSPQEMFDFTIRAFNLAETFRIPVLIMADEVVGHTLERVTIPPAEKIEIVNRKKPSTPPEDYLPYKTDSSLIPVLPDAGGHFDYLDLDDDGYGDEDLPITACEAPSGYVDMGGDCDDTDPALNPLDVDGDGVSTCDVPIDCNDAEPLESPALGEVTCDGLDNDCDPATLDSDDGDGDGYSPDGASCGHFWMFSA